MLEKKNPVNLLLHVAFLYFQLLFHIVYQGAQPCSFIEISSVYQEKIIYLLFLLSCFCFVFPSFRCVASCVAVSVIIALILQVSESKFSHDKVASKINP